MFILSVEKQVKELFMDSVFFFIVGVVLGSLFVWCMIQGALIHLSGTTGPFFTDKDALAYSFYFIGWICGVGALALYWQAKNRFHYAEISK